METLLPQGSCGDRSRRAARSWTMPRSSEKGMAGAMAQLPEASVLVPSVSIPSGGGESAGCDPFPSSRNPITLVSARHIRPSDLARGIEVDIKRKLGDALLQIRCPLLITRHIV